MASNEQHTPQDPSTAIVEASETVRDIFTYPAANVSAPGGDAGGVASSTPAIGGAAGKLAEDTIRQALGWRYRPSDVKGFKSALQRSFALAEDQDGRTEWKWTPQTYAVQADMGEITGAQASILEQARITINYVLPLIDGLKPLRIDSDAEDVHAVTALVRMKLGSILSELGRVGGPRVQRVDLLFEELLGIPVVEFKRAPTGAAAGTWDVVVIKDSDDWIAQYKALDAKLPPEKNAYGLLYQLSEEYGLVAGLANTVDEERDLTNALILVDSVIALRTAWLGKRGYFDRADGKKPRFLGTQLVWISRQLEVVAESVRDAYTAMDSVYFGPQEREATDIFYVFEAGKAGEPELDAAPISVGDLLDWVYSFATQEGPQLLQDGGKDGVLAFRSTLSRLAQWVRAAGDFARKGQGNAPCSFFNARVEHALGELEHQLRITLNRTVRIDRFTRLPAQSGPQIADLASPPGARVESIGLPPEGVSNGIASSTGTNLPAAGAGAGAAGAMTSKGKFGAIFGRRHEDMLEGALGPTGESTATATPIIAPAAPAKPSESKTPPSSHGHGPKKS